MAARSWETENVPDPDSIIPPDGLFEILSEAIDTQAKVFTEPALFRNAVYQVLSHAHTLNVDALAAALAWQRLERIFACLEHFDRPEVTLDALRCLAHMNDEHGVFMADLARKHSISRQCLYKRVQRVARFVGVDYQRRKAKGKPSQELS